MLVRKTVFFFMKTCLSRGGQQDGKESLQNETEGSEIIFIACMILTFSLALCLSSRQLGLAQSKKVR